MGSLEIIVGPMFSGKTELLLYRHKKILNNFWNWCIHDHMKPETNFAEINRLPNYKNIGYDSTYEFYNKTNSDILLAINYHKDTRYGDDIISSHNGNQIPSHNLQNLSELFTDPDKRELLNKCVYIFINEAQFFADLKDSVIQLIEEYNKHVIICGLDGDFKREKFGQIWDLIPHADTITKLKGKCNKCNNYSLFTHRVTSENEQEVIGSNNYIPLCRACWCKETCKKNTVYHFMSDVIS
jgi:thymidine kinase